MKCFVLAVLLNCKNSRVTSYFKMALKTGSLIFLVTESFESNFGITSFFTMFENKLFKASVVSDSDHYYCSLNK